MIPLAGCAVLTAAEMRAAEDRAIADGASVAALMQRAGTAIADAILRLAGANDVLILCGPGNNGGDGYVAATCLAATGRRVRIAASGLPRTDAAQEARRRWAGQVEPLADVSGAAVIVDCLYGTGVSRPLADGEAAALVRLVSEATLAIAVDMPSGVSADDGCVLGTVPAFQVTLALGAAKPSHLLQPGAARCGAVRVLPIGVDAEGDTRVLAAPSLLPPAVDAHKFSRGMVAVVKGRMAGAAHLAAKAAMHGGAGYVALLGSTIPEAPHALVRRRFDDDALDDSRIDALVIGPGLGRDEEARTSLERALETAHPLVIDGDALHLVSPERLAERAAATVLTPHAGEFVAMFGAPAGSKIAAARDAALRARATVVFKGPDTVIASPDGRVVVAEAASAWLSTAGTGDVLAGAIGAMLAGGRDPLDAAAAGVWLHGEAARRLGPAFIADELATALAGVRA